MPRSSRSSRPAPARSAPAQTRSASTMAAPAPPMARPAPPATAPGAHPSTGTQTTSSGQPGMLAQMAATAGSVAVGSTIGHGLSSMLFGGSSSAPAEQAQPSNQDLASQHQQAGLGQMNAMNGRCDIPARDFTKCLEVADYQSCSYYLEQLKACQAAASQY